MLRSSLKIHELPTAVLSLKRTPHKDTFIIEVASGSRWEKAKRERGGGCVCVRVVCGCPIRTICRDSCRRTSCLRESQFISWEGLTTCDIWQWSIRHFIQLFQTQTHKHTVEEEEEDESRGRGGASGLEWS